MYFYQPGVLSRVMSETHHVQLHAIIYYFSNQLARASLPFLDKTKSQWSWSRSSHGWSSSPSWSSPQYPHPQTIQTLRYSISPDGLSDAAQYTTLSPQSPDMAVVSPWSAETGMSHALSKSVRTKTTLILLLPLLVSQWYSHLSLGDKIWWKRTRTSRSNLPNWPQIVVAVIVLFWSTRPYGEWIRRNRRRVEED